MRARVLGALLYFSLLGAVIYWGYVTQVKPMFDLGPTVPFIPLPRMPFNFSERTPVPSNRGPEVLDGFRGEVHPFFSHQNEVKVTANWDFKNQEKVFAKMDKSRSRFFRNFQVAIPSKTYSERDFSCFLPAGDFHAVGQIWALDLEKVAEFLKQFHPQPSMHLVAKGRRAGPDGAFAILRAASPTHLEIVFRIHAEFDLLLQRGGSIPFSEAWYTPACFLGRLVLNRNPGMIEYFSLSLPTDKAINVHFTAAVDMSEGHDVAHVECMELIGGNAQSVADITWMAEIEAVKAYDRLAKVFYKFKEINWIAFDRVQAKARDQKKPIFAAILWGALEDQSC